MAQRAYKKGEYKSSLSILRKKYNIKSSKVNSAVLQLYALNLEKLSRYETALKYYLRLMNKQYRKLNRKVMRKVARTKSYDDLGELPKKLLFYYSRTAIIFSRLYQRDISKGNKRRLGFYKAKTKMFGEICLEQEYAEDEVEEAIGRLDKVDQEIKKKVFRKSWLASIEYVSWHDSVDLVSESTGIATELISTTEGWCLGGGWQKENDFIEYNFKGCLAFAGATIGVRNSGQSAIEYKQSGVFVLGLLAGPGVIWKPKGTPVGFGVSLPFVYRSGSYQDATVAGESFTIDGATKISLGPLIESQWHYTKWDFVIKFGKLLNFPGSYWSLGMQYNF